MLRNYSMGVIAGVNKGDVIAFQSHYRPLGNKEVVAIRDQYVVLGTVTGENARGLVLISLQVVENMDYIVTCVDGKPKEVKKVIEHYAPHHHPDIFEILRLGSPKPFFIMADMKDWEDIFYKVIYRNKYEVTLDDSRSSCILKSN